MPYVIGHRNPDTDAICAAIAYANLLQQTGTPAATAAACGTPNLRTKFTLKKAGVNPPRLLMDVRPTTGDICKTKVMVARLDESFMDVYRRMQKHRLKAIPVVDGERRVLGILPLMNLMKLLIPDEQDLGEQRILQASLARVRNVLGASFQHEVDIHNENESLVMYIAAMSTEGFMGRISEYPAARLMVLVGDRPSIQKAAIDVGVRSLLITGGARMSEELLARARERNVAVMCSPVDTAMTALLVRTAKSVRAALRTDYLEFGPRVLLHTIRDQVQDVWEVSHLELRLALCAAGKGITYLSDRLLADIEGFHAIEGLEVSSFEREVGLYYKKHQALSEGAKRFIGICQRDFSPQPGPSRKT